MKLCTFCYVPPPQVSHPEAFLRNLAKFRCKTDALIFSEHPWQGALRLRGSPEDLRNATFPQSGERNKFAIPNATFLTGAKISLDQGYTHAIVLEPDCRVGRDDWDQVIWEEYFSLGRPVIAAGTLVSYNPCNHSPEAERRWNALIRRNTKRNFPIVTYGHKGAGQAGGTCIFPNGALAVYDLRWIAKFFNLATSLNTAVQITAWDLAIGYKIWEAFGTQSYDVTANLECIFSGYGDLVTTVEQRRRMLLNGDCIAYHQEKTDFEP